MGVGVKVRVVLEARAITASRRVVDESPSSSPSRGGSMYSAEPLATTAGAAAALVKLPSAAPKSVSPPWLGLGLGLELRVGVGVGVGAGVGLGLGLPTVHDGQRDGDVEGSERGEQLVRLAAEADGLGAARE